MKKAQESVLMEHIVPLRMIFPGQSTGGNDGPYGSYNLTNWKAKVDAEINTWKRDNNYIPVLPVNVGFQQFGGQAKALMMYQEMRMLSEQMLAGMGIPQEFIFGGLQWSGSNTSLRALENMLLGYNTQRKELIIDFVIKKIARFMKWPTIGAKFEKFKMADDLQRAMFYLQLNQAQKVSDRRLLEELQEDFDLENERMGEELKRQLQTNRKMQIATADIQGEAQLKQSRYQAKSQVLMQKAQQQAQEEAQQKQMEQQQAQQAQQPPQDPSQDPQLHLQQLQTAKEEAKAEAAKHRAAKAEQDNKQENMETEQKAMETGNMKQFQSEGEQPADGAQQTPGLPGDATAYDENASDPNRQSMPAGMESTIQPGQGGVDLQYIAQRAVSYLRTVRQQSGEEGMYQELQKMQLENNQLYQLVIQLLDDRGAKENPLDAMQNPNPTGQADPGRQVTG
jgi:hypothetical protein